MDDKLAKEVLWAGISLQQQTTLSVRMCYVRAIKAAANVPSDQDIHSFGFSSTSMAYTHQRCCCLCCCQLKQLHAHCTAPSHAPAVPSQSHNTKLTFTHYSSLLLQLLIVPGPCSPAPKGNWHCSCASSSSQSSRSCCHSTPTSWRRAL
jgi:hypothetical protein